jgi:ferredoxin
MHVIERASFQRLLDAIARRGYALVGPKRGENAVAYEPIESADDLPVGVSDEIERGSYRLKTSTEGRLFGYTAAAQSWKRFLYPPRTMLWRAQRSGHKYDITDTESRGDPPKLAFIGVRPCELKGIEVLDKVFVEGLYIDRCYKARRENSLVVVVNCSRAAATCFCTSMHSGPRAEAGYDLALTEIMEPSRHYFTVESRSMMGDDILRELELPEATEDEQAASQAESARAAAGIRRSVDLVDLPAVLTRRRDDPRWEDVAKRCLTCANCTMVCPTCFCHTVEDTTDLAGDVAERWRSWDSCFTVDFSYIHGGSVRKTGLSRYRQWLTHKFASWPEQFGTSGCVGCGRCIAWCPVGIDLTEELRALRQRDGSVHVGTQQIRETSHAGA